MVASTPDARVVHHASTSSVLVGADARAGEMPDAARQKPLSTMEASAPDASAPTPLAILSTHITAGSGSSCAVVNGDVKCWGTDTLGELGDNMTSPGSAPAQSAVPAQVIGLTSGVQAVSAGYWHACALVNGGVQCWGGSSGGQLGNNSRTNSLVPVQVTGLTSGVQAISVGWDHACALLADGVQCWGESNSLGEFPTSNATAKLVPESITGLPSAVQAISAGLGHNCVLVDGGASCWGANGAGQLGDGSTNPSLTPVQVKGLQSGVQAISAGSDHSCAVVNGSAMCWGGNASGQLGNDSTNPSLTPVQVTGLTSGVQAISSGGAMTCALVNDGVQCWGHNFFGDLGNNTKTDSLVPVQVTGLQSGVREIAAAPSGYHACALTDDGIRCWGWNTYGQLGNNAVTDSAVPVAVVGSSP